MPRAAKGTARGPLHPARPCLTRLRSGFPTAWHTRCPRQPNTGRLADALGLSRVWRTMRRLALALRPEFSADLWSVLGRWIRDTPWFRLVPDDLISRAQHTFRHHDEEALQALLKPVAAAPPTALTAVSRRLRRTGSAPTDRPSDRPQMRPSPTPRVRPPTKRVRRPPTADRCGPSCSAPPRRREQRAAPEALEGSAGEEAVAVWPGIGGSLQSSFIRPKWSGIDSNQRALPSTVERRIRLPLKRVQHAIGSATTCRLLIPR